MTETHRPRVKYVIGPDGSPLTIADLPAPGTKRWVIRRKAEVVAAVRGGLLSLEEACSRYTLTVEEFLSWQAFDRPARPRGSAHHAHSAVPRLKPNPTEFLKRRPQVPAFFICELANNQSPEQCPICGGNIAAQHAVLLSTRRCLWDKQTEKRS